VEKVRLLNGELAARELSQRLGLLGGEGELAQAVEEVNGQRAWEAFGGGDSVPRSASEWEHRGSVSRFGRGKQPQNTSRSESKERRSQISSRSAHSPMMHVSLGSSVSLESSPVP